MPHETFTDFQLMNNRTRQAAAALALDIFGNTQVAHTEPVAGMLAVACHFLTFAQLAGVDPVAAMAQIVDLPSSNNES